MEPTARAWRLLVIALTPSLPIGCRFAPLQIYDGPRRSPGEVARVHTGEGFWGDKELFLAEVNGTRLWDPDSTRAHLFRAFVAENDVEVLPGDVELTAGQGQEVNFQAEAGTTYFLSLAPSAHDTVPVLVVETDPDRRRITDSEPRIETLTTMPWQPETGWTVIDWLRYRPPHAGVETDVITYEYSPPPDAMGNWTGATWLTSVGLTLDPQMGEKMALAADMLLDLEIDYRDISTERDGSSAQLARWSGTARDGGLPVSGIVAVERVGGVLRAFSSVGPGPWALEGSALESAWTHAMGLER